LRKSRIFLSILILLTIITPVVYAADEATYTYTLTYTFENEGAEPLTLIPEDYTLPLFINNTWQTVIIVNSSIPYTVTEIDMDGNMGILMDVDPELPPGGTLSYTVEYLIESTEQEKPEFSLTGGNNEIPTELITQYTGSTETFPKDDETVHETALRAAWDAETVIGVVSNLLEYVTKNTTYCNFETPRYPLQTLSENLGDCDDQAILLITMCRSLGIPAYLKVGIVVNPAIQDSDTSWDGHLTNIADGIGWHGWAMIYIPPWGWVPVDLTLVSEDTGFEYIMNAPEYGVNLIEVLDVSDQSYIGGTLETRERIINSTLYVTVEDQADRVNDRGLVTETYIMLAIGSALVVAVFMMFRASND
jgi:transglutaminase-like putative cysteine protease